MLLADGKSGINLSPSRSLDSWPAVIGFCGVAIAVQVILGGIRPGNGSILAQFARDGFGAQVSTFAEYLFDSPLQILFLHALGIQSLSWIGVVFVVLSFLPFVAASLAADESTRKTCFVLLAALPMTRISFASLGVGDAVLIACAVAIVVSSSWPMFLLSSAAMPMWHMQQGSILLCLLAGIFFCCGDAADKRKLPYIAIGAVVGLISFVLIRIFLAPQHHGRGDFLLQYIDRFLLRMLFYWPVVISVALPGLLAIWLSKGRNIVHWSIWMALAGTFLLSAVTSDVSRVFFVLGFPITLFALLKYGVHNREAPILRKLQVLVPVLALSSVVPLLGWGASTFSTGRGW